MIRDFARAAEVLTAEAAEADQPLTAALFPERQAGQALTPEDLASLPERFERARAAGTVLPGFEPGAQPATQPSAGEAIGEEEALRLVDEASWNHRIVVVEGVLADECREMMQEFFKETLFKK